MTRQIVLDTETTGLEVGLGHRIIEIGCVEMVNRRVTGNDWHFYFNPDREVDSGAFEVHGISNEFLADKSRFSERAADFLSYVEGSELIIHNAAFDVGFLNAELAALDPPEKDLESCCQILDTLVLARQKHPGQRNNLDALCKRYEIDNSHRSLHGALLDARILADVYLIMTGGQTTLGLDASQAKGEVEETDEVKRIEINQPLPLWQIDDESMRANREYVDFLAAEHSDPAWK
ncbi:MAG: DNA polymerase III subunit epsilon [Pseudomonadota bacterium]